MRTIAAAVAVVVDGGTKRTEVYVACELVAVAADAQEADTNP